MRLYGNIQKIDKEQRIVAGYASTEAVDAHGEVVTKAAIEAALEGYLEFANVREMHQLSAVGVTEEASVDDKGLYIAAKITDDIAWGKVKSGTYKGFSIGGKTLARDPDNRKIITKIALNEISLVDRPSNPEARFDVWKAAGLHDGGDLAKVIGERDSLAAQLAARDRAIAELADGIEKALTKVTEIVNANLTYRQQNANLTKKLAAFEKPHLVHSVDIAASFSKLGELEKAVVGVEADVVQMRSSLDRMRA
jgi:HK97 family phage prohead protease